MDDLLLAATLLPQGDYSHHYCVHIVRVDSLCTYNSGGRKSLSVHTTDRNSSEYHPEFHPEFHTEGRAWNPPPPLEIEYSYYCGAINV